MDNTILEVGKESEARWLTRSVILGLNISMLVPVILGKGGASLSIYLLKVGPAQRSSYFRNDPTTKGEGGTSSWQR